MSNIYAGLTTIFGISNTATSSVGNYTDALSAFRRAKADGAEEKGMAAEAKESANKLVIDRFKTALAKAKTVEEALKDPRVMSFLLPALGLADQVGMEGIARKAFVSDPAEKGGFLEKLGSDSWTNAAKTLNLAEKGLDGLKDEKVQQSLIDGFLKYQWRTGLDDTTPGVSKALYFEEQAASMEGIYDVLGNAVVREVITDAYGIPKEIAVQSLEAQSDAVLKRVKLADLKDEKKTEKIAERYIMSQAGTATSTSSNPTSYLLSILG